MRRWWWYHFKYRGYSLRNSKAFDSIRRGFNCPKGRLLPYWLINYFASIVIGMHTMYMQCFAVKRMILTFRNSIITGRPYNGKTGFLHMYRLTFALKIS